MRRSWSLPPCNVITSYIRRDCCGQSCNQCLHSRSGDAMGGICPRSQTLKSISPKPAPPNRRAACPRRLRAAKPYHHGDLRRVLIDAALDLVGEGGPEAVSVREAARRAGVSPGAPFRHFPSRDALMTAVAEEAQRRFRPEIEAALAAAACRRSAGAVSRHSGSAYLRWAMRNPAHFEIISTADFRSRRRGSCRATMPS